MPWVAKVTVSTQTVSGGTWYGCLLTIFPMAHMASSNDCVLSYGKNGMQRTAKWKLKQAGGIEKEETNVKTPLYINSINAQNFRAKNQ